VGPNQESKGHKGRPAGDTLSWFRPKLDGYTPKSVYKSIPGLKVGGDQEEWPTGQLDGCPAVPHLQTDSIKSVEAPLDLYIRIIFVEFRTHHTQLVVESQAKPYQESRVESSLRSSSGSSLRHQ
jgi:hypothetical protein